MFGFSYTYSESLDNGSNYRDIVPDTYNTSNLWGPSEYDTRHIAIINYQYHLPFFKNQTTLAGKLIGGWDIVGQMTVDVYSALLDRKTRKTVANNAAATAFDPKTN